MFILFWNLEFCDVRKHYDVCYFVLEMFVMMGSTSVFDFYVLCYLFYCILLLDKNYR